MKSVPTPTDLIPLLNLQVRLEAAMKKAGYGDRVSLVPAFVHQDYYDVSGIRVLANNPDIRIRAAAWVKKALVLAGVKEWHTGAWQGPCVMGDPGVLNTMCYGEAVTLVRVITASIGD